MTDQTSGPTDQRARVSTEGDRKAYVRDWIARRLRTRGIAGTGLAGTLLTLPMIASAQAGDGFVTASRIDGVTNVQTLSDGSVRLVMSNGTTISVPASDVRAAANGDVLVSARVEEIAAEVMAAGGGGAAGGGAIIAGLGAGAALAAAAGGGGGGDGGDGGTLPVINSEVLAASGGLSSENTGITVPEGTTSVDVTLVDEDGNETTREGQVDGDGGWTLPFAAEDTPPQGRVTVTVASRDSDGEELDTTSQDVNIDTIAPSITIDDTGVGPDDTLNIAEQGAGITVSGATDAEDGQVVTVTLDGTEYTGTVTGGAWSVDIPASGLAGLDPTDTEVPLTAAVEDAAGNAGDTSETILLDLVAPTISLDDVSGDNQIGLIDTQGDLEITGTTDAEAGQEVTVTFDGQDFTGTVGSGGGSGAEPNAWTVTVPQSAVQAVEAGAINGLASIDVAATVADAAGNPAATPERTIDADFRGPSIAIDPITGDDVINIAERDDAGGITISGSTNNVPAGQDVTVQLGGTALPAVQTDANGDWQVTVPQGDSSLPADGASVTVTADVSDGETAAPQASVPLDADFTAPSITITDTGVGPDDTLNIAEQGAGISVEGTATGADGQTVTVTLSGGGTATPITATGTVSGGTFAAAFTPADLAGIGAWSMATVTAEVSDAAGNPATPATDGFDIDVTAPTIAITDTGVGPDDILNIAEQAAGIIVEGTATGADGQTVTVTLSGQAAATSITATGTVTGGTFAVAFDDTDLAGIGAWSMATVTAEVSDAAGNPATPATDSFDIDVTAPAISITNTGLGPDGVLDIAEQSAGITIEGSATVADGQQATVTLSGPGGPITATGTVMSGSFAAAFAPTDLSGLDDQTSYTASISVDDAAGNPASDSFALTTDFKPIVAFDEIGEDGAVDLADTIDPTLSGTTLGVEQGRDVTVTITAPDNSTLLNTTAAVAADGTWSLTVPQSAIDQLVAGEAYSIEATVSNAAGRAADPATETVDAYLAAVYAVANTAESGTTLSMTAFATDGLDAVAGIEPEMSFDPGLASYILGSATNEFDLFTVNDTNAATGFVGFIGGNLTDQIPEGEVILGFDMEDQGAGPITLSFTDDAQGGPTELQIGTSGAENLTAPNTDAVIQGKGGDDTIDVSATGTNVILFDLDQASNGTDSVNGFSTGTGFQSDQIAFLGQVDLRGAGDTVEALASGGAIGADAGFVIFTTALADTGDTTLETALEGLTGEQAGDVFYALAGDGSDAALVRATVNGADDVSLERLADFTGIGDLGNLSEDNVILPDAVTQVT